MFPLEMFSAECSLVTSTACSVDCFVKSGAFERVRLELLPEQMYEEITAEQLVIDVAALSDLTEDEVRQTGVQNNLVALHLTGNVPEHRQDLHRLAQGLRPASGECFRNWTCGD